MKRIFTWQFVLISLVLTVITYAVVNGPIVGTEYLEKVVPGVIIPDQTPKYSPDQLSGFFQAMGERGRSVYITVNNLDFLFIISNAMFGVSALGTMLRYLLKNKRLATGIALIGLLPASFDAIESICFRLIVLNPHDNHPTLSSIASISTPTKFTAYNLMLILLLGLLVVCCIIWLKRRHNAH